MQSGNNDLVAQIKRDWRSAPLAESDRAMLAYAEKLTVNPSGLTLSDLNSLRAHFSEEQAFDIVVIACLFNFIDRVADAFGVELDPIMQHLAASSPEGEALKELAAAHRGRRSP